MVEKDLTSRTIPGITWKQIVAYSVALAMFVTFYIDLKNAAGDAKKQGESNNELLKEFIQDAKQERKLDDARLQAIELQIRECKIRLDIMENFVEGYNKPPR